MDAQPFTVAIIDTSPSTVGSMREYVDHLVEQLSALPPADRPRIRRVHLALSSNIAERLPPRLRWWANVGRVIWASRRLQSVQADVYHIADGSFAFLASSIPDGRAVVTVHDIIPHLRLGSTLGPRRGSLVARAVLRAQRRGFAKANLIVAVSACTARDIATLLGAGAPAIRVIPISSTGVTRQLQVESRTAMIKDGAPFVLHVGHNGFYKNREGALRVFARVAGQEDVRMVMAGPRPTIRLRSLVRRLGLTSKVTFAVNPSTTGLADLYRNAGVLLVTSLYEGFGLPVLEAMAAGCPVVCSDAGALPEVSADAALFASYKDDHAMASHVARLLRDPIERSRLAEAGRARAAQIQSVNAAEQLVARYKELASPRGPGHR